MPQINPIKDWVDRLARFQAEAVGQLSHIESSRERKYTLDESYRRLNSLNIVQDELFRQALRCVEVNVFRAAHVMTWCAVMDCIYSLIESDHFALLSTHRPKWAFNGIDELKDKFTEHAIIDALKPMGILTRSEQKAFFGMLSKRNECAHPGTYFPDFNQTLGYISESIDRISKIEKKHSGFQL